MKDKWEKQNNYDLILIFSTKQLSNFDDQKILCQYHINSSPFSPFLKLKEKNENKKKIKADREGDGWI